MPDTPEKKNGNFSKEGNVYTTEPVGKGIQDEGEVYAEYQSTSDEKAIANEIVTSSRPVSRASRKSRLSVRSRTSNKVVPENKNQTLPGSN